MDKGYEEITCQGSLIALIIRAGYRAEKITFFTPPEYSQQLGYLPHKAGDIIEPHVHKLNRREVHYTQEALLIRKGRVRVDLYDNQRKFLSSHELAQGDIIILCNGGHGFNMLEDCEMIEVKQGPYSGKDDDKEVFKGVSK